MISARELAERLAAKSDGFPDMGPVFRGKFLGPVARLTWNNRDMVVVAVDHYESILGPGLGLVDVGQRDRDMSTLLGNAAAWDWAYGENFDKCTVTWVKSSCPMESESLPDVPSEQF